MGEPKTSASRRHCPSRPPLSSVSADPDADCGPLPVVHPVGWPADPRTAAASSETGGCGAGWGMCGSGRCRANVAASDRRKRPAPPLTTAATMRRATAAGSMPLSEGRHQHAAVGCRDRGGGTAAACALPPRSRHRHVRRPVVEEPRPPPRLVADAGGLAHSRGDARPTATADAVAAADRPHSSYAGAGGLPAPRVSSAPPPPLQEHFSFYFARRRARCDCDAVVAAPATATDTLTRAAGRRWGPRRRVSAARCGVPTGAQW